MTSANSSSGAPELHSFTLGPFETNCYVVAPPSEKSAGRPCWIVDASFEPAPIVDFVQKAGLLPEAIVLTHAHVDHIAGVAELVAAFSPRRTGRSAPLPVWIHQGEKEWLSNPILNLSGLSGMEVTAPGPDRLLVDGEMLSLGSTNWKVLHTPGHSPGGITLYDAASGIALVGDTLFAGSVGRTDFPGSDQGTLFEAIRSKLYVLPDATRAYPGHGPATTIGREKKHNPFVRA